MQASDVLSFWFEKVDKKLWWSKDDAFDQLIREKFESFHTAAMAGELFEWRSEPQGRLAEIIVLDQFSRNMYRDTPKAFSSDPLALVLAQEAVAHSVDQKLEVEKRAFLYLPYMHSESLKIHEVAMQLYSQPGLEFNYDFEVKHKQIIDQFGRYPHRNQILGRESTPEEKHFLTQPGSSF